MARVHIPPQLRKLTAGQRTVEVAGVTLREVLEALEELHPGTFDRLVVEDTIRPGLAVAVDDVISVKGLRHPIDDDSEIHFVPAVSGG